METHDSSVNESTTELNWTLPISARPVPRRRAQRPSDDCNCCYGNICKNKRIYERAEKRALEIESGAIPMAEKSRP